MSDSPSLAERMYPSMASSPATPSPAPASAPAAPPLPTVADRLYSGLKPSVAPTPAEDNVTARRMYPVAEPLKAEELPPEIAELRADPARRMFNAERTYAPAGVATLFEGQANAPEEMRAWSNILADNDASTQEAAVMVDLTRQVRKELPTDETVSSWEAETHATLRTKYGDKTDDTLSLARRLIARDPRVSDFLLRSGLGSHPRVVAMVVEKALSMRAAGRLK